MNFDVLPLSFLCNMHNTYIMNKNNPRWWQDCIGYIIYPYSFKDSNGDGIGDLQGIISKLDYLCSLGVDLVWICPIFDSPMDDNGYDVRDYEHINPIFGTDEDFKQLLIEAHKRDMAIVIDFVLNHTSDEHPWFQKALKDPSCKEHGYYIFRKGRYVNGELLPPNNWKGYFSTSVWKRVEGTDEFYFHLFSSRMPDVNWENPELRAQYQKLARRYLELGVDGFRLDACAHLSKDMTFADASNPVDAHGLSFDASKFSNREPLFGYLQEMKRTVFEPYRAFTVGEVGGGLTPEDSLKLSDRETGSISMVFNFDCCWNNGGYGSIDKKDEEINTNLFQLKDNFMRWYRACHARADMPLYWCNHDHPRVMNMYGSKEYRKESAKCLTSILLFMYGVPFLYQGDELGMSNLVTDKTDVFESDPNTRNEMVYLRERGYSEQQIAHYMCRCARTNARQSMPWNASKNGGFTDGISKSPANLDYLEGVNAEDEANDPDSILNFTKEAIALRKTPFMQRMIREGSLEILDYNHPDVLAFMHELDGERLIVIASMRKFDTYFSFFWTVKGVYLHNYADTIYENHVFHLRPFECFVLKV